MLPVEWLVLVVMEEVEVDTLVEVQEALVVVVVVAVEEWEWFVSERMSQLGTRS